jgi:hypothetical protein
MASAPRKLSLLIPGLGTWSASYCSPSENIRALEILLSRSEQIACKPDFHALVCDLFDLHTDPEKNLPVAPVTYLFDTCQHSIDWWVRADPVAMRPDGGCLLMLGNDLLTITQNEADALVNEVQALFTSQGWELSAPSPKRWYLRLPCDPNVFFHSLTELPGEDIHAYLPNAPWRRIMNEAQMILHNSPTNQMREARGELPINSLWFWGAGILPSAPKPGLTHVWSDEAFSAGLARLSRIPHNTGPENATAWLAQPSNLGEQLVVLSATSRYTAASLEQLNSEWFAPLLAALKSRRLNCLHLYTSQGKSFRATSSSVKHWWKRTRRLTHLL